ncbi:hypothetical protein RND81_01G080300 [Saponaria officinalis]|uniref:PHD-type domain-containing protein n=2 Tax=Saponaria officinalis TaxID=3572 RepID=A0AAW1NHC7_SAPOF
MGKGEDYVLALPFNVVESREFRLARSELKRELGCVVSEAELLEDIPRKKLVLEGLDGNNDDIFSEISGPIVCSTVENDNASSLGTSGSQPVELGECNNAVHSGDITSESSGNSWVVTCSDEETRRRGSSSGVSTSQVTLEIPKHASTTGIRKITFKFSKSKDEHVSRLSTSGGRSVHNNKDSVIDSNDELGLDDSCDRFSYNMELKMSKKVVPDIYPTNVKKLLATGILEGAMVKYVSTSGEKEIPGKISGSGYLCGCSMCNYTNVLSAYEFEQHAGGAKTRHPNNHIFLENGKPIYSIIEGLKTAPPGLLEELVKDMAGSSFNHGSFHAWKDSLRKCNGLVQEEKKHRKIHCSFSKGHHRLSSATSLAAGPCKRSTERGMRKRDNDLHRLLFLPNGIPDGSELAYYAKGQKVLGGYKNGNGIICGHCSCEISPSQFEAHAGWATRRQPYRHIYTANGYTLHDLAMSMVNGQNMTTGNNDDMCTVCGDRGELIPCGGCPRAYHQACLGLESVPSSDWHCPNCNDRRTDFIDSSSTSKPITGRLTRVVKKPEPECGGCVLCRANDFSVDKFDDRTVIICDQCEKEYHVGCLREAGRSDLKELPQDKWFCCHDCDSIYVALKDLVARGPIMISGSEAIKISRKLFLNGISVADNDVQWRILSGKCRQPEHLPLLSKAVSIFRECFSPITAKIGRDLIPVMVHGRNISGQEFGGMYCVLVTVKSVVVSAGLLRIFGREVAELPLVATSKGYQGKGFFQALFSRIEMLLSVLKVENLVLPAAEKAKSMWVNRFGFRDVSREQLWFYTRDYQLSEFSGTVMLEKKVGQMID